MQCYPVFVDNDKVKGYRTWLLTHDTFFSSDTYKLQQVRYGCVLREIETPVWQSVVLDDITTVIEANSKEIGSVVAIFVYRRKSSISKEQVLS